MNVSPSAWIALGLLCSPSDPSGLRILAYGWTRMSGRTDMQVSSRPEAGGQLPAPKGCGARRRAGSMPNVIGAGVSTQGVITLFVFTLSLTTRTDHLEEFVSAEETSSAACEEERRQPKNGRQRRCLRSILELANRFARPAQSAPSERSLTT
jgi:hypothetical protein